MEKEKFDRNAFLYRLIQESMKAIMKEPEDLDRLYSGYKTLVQNQLKSTPEREAECNEILGILRKAYTMFSDPEVEDIIIRNNITAKQFVSRYGEKLLGDNKRKYDMTDRFNPGLIGTYETKGVQYGKIEHLPQGRKLKYVSGKREAHEYLDMEGQEISIQEIGKLYFEEWNGLKSDITKYRVKRQLAENVFQVNEIFSNIKIIEMDNPDYREAVLGELLSQNNIELSKAGGYVGEITDVPTSERMQIGDEKLMAGDYFYRISPQYMLRYHSEDVTAAMLLEEAQTNRSKIGMRTNQSQKEKDNKIIKFPVKDKKVGNGERPSGGDYR